VARVKRAVNAHKKRRSTLEAASGYRGQRSRLYRKAKEQLLHSATYQYRDRKARKGDFRQLWITRINAAARANDITYNRLIQGLRLAGVTVDRKVLADLAVTDPTAFSALVEVARAVVGKPRVVLLDEPSEGVAPVIVEQMAHMILALKAEGVSILLSEQNLHFARLVSDRAVVLEKGEVKFTGSMQALMSDETLLRTHLSL